MGAEAKIVLSYAGAKTAKAIAEAVSPDNFKTPKELTVRTACAGGEVTTRIACDGKLATFIATIDDLLSCISTAEKTVSTTQRVDR